MANTIRIKRRLTGSAGAPASLANAELAFNEVDGKLDRKSTRLNSSHT